MNTMHCIRFPTAKELQESHPYVTWLSEAMEIQYIQDYMDNNRIVVNKNGTVEQVTQYYPYGGVIGDISTLLSDVTKGNNENVQKYKFEGPRSHQKEIDNLLARRRAFRRGVELDRTFGLDNYDIHARNYFAMAPTWDRIDSKAEDYYHLSPYSYCAGNPVNFGDYDGESTRVIRTDSTHYQVVGGDINDGDYNIYVCIDTGEEGDDRYANTGVSIGITPTMTSFYNSDNKQWIGTIDVQDNSANSFIETLETDDPSLLSYALNARNYKKYDFKATNGGEEVLYNKTDDYYRGMPLGYGKDGARIYASARDIGNISAGIVARKRGLSWNTARIGFDSYQSLKTLKYQLNYSPNGASNYFTIGWTPEGVSTQNAQKFGYSHIFKKYR